MAIGPGTEGSREKARAATRGSNDRTLGAGGRHAQAGPLVPAGGAGAASVRRRSEEHPLAAAIGSHASARCDDPAAHAITILWSRLLAAVLTDSTGLALADPRGL